MNHSKALEEVLNRSYEAAYLVDLDTLDPEEFEAWMTRHERMVLREWRCQGRFNQQ